MNNLLKKQKVGAYLYVAVFVLTLVCFIIYLANGANKGYFQGTTESVVVLLSILGLLFTLAVIIIPQFTFNGVVAKIMNVLVEAIRIVIPLVLMSAFIIFTGSRLEGLSYIFFSNANTLAEIQTSVNLASAYTAITGIVFFLITQIVSVVATFFPLTKSPEELEPIVSK
ncbi:MAG: hypothetical protein WCR56_05305 [Bacilli bacterium]|jgi:fumarate reductase subunit C